MAAVRSLARLSASPSQEAAAKSAVVAGLTAALSADPDARVRTEAAIALGASALPSSGTYWQVHSLETRTLRSG